MAGGLRGRQGQGRRARSRLSSTSAWISCVNKVEPGMKASMAHDLERGNRLELDWLAGKVRELGRAAQHPDAGERHRLHRAQAAPHGRAALTPRYRFTGARARRRFRYRETENFCGRVNARPATPRDFQRRHRRGDLPCYGRERACHTMIRDRRAATPPRHEKIKCCRAKTARGNVACRWVPV